MGHRLSILSESRVRDIRSLGSMRRDVETESGRLDCGTAIRKGRQQLRGAYSHRATSRPYDQLREGKPLELRLAVAQPVIRAQPGETRAAGSRNAPPTSTRAPSHDARLGDGPAPPRAAFSRFLKRALAGPPPTED